MNTQTEISRELRFWARVEKSAGCWEWTGKKDARGYGQLLKKAKYTKAHRFSYALTNGEIPHGMSVLHRCDNPGCVNPDHLFLGDQAANLRDMHSKGRGSGCIGPEQAYAILWERVSGVPRKTIMKEYGVSLHVVKDIASRRSWQSLSQQPGQQGVQQPY